MTDELTVAVGSLTAAMLVGSTLVARNWPAWERTPLPKPAVRSVYVSLDELLDGGEVEANDFAWCPTERRTRFHAIRRDRSRRCWTCATQSPAGAR
ncbi:hypothetical protein PV729_45515 [Streptomyces europaeiscabiei]|uniref:Secreted protein n=1 Tax=Streptomyces europaeiscabiei TaxID=146819 RepID=A0ABU4NX34_9ACTN|nr:hypothetical protein [Streptomyces europaeiscabiei]MDX2763363.1 hypothetical protein [Streptomyces europaeiscabiei]MDX3544362.1 hypothetical protein [Streptomyces europaeiscabiei]MDX3558835.1 hypothetical protein [Streptomyces europaeiscabiei]MDX3707229.1 hypothetical protein [Streptomyces europaeiscabiei]